MIASLAWIAAGFALGLAPLLIPPRRQPPRPSAVIIPFRRKP